MESSIPSAEVLADAAARRHTTNTDAPTAQSMEDHEKRQNFRRLIDPGIFRPNSKEVAMDSLKSLSTIANNILREPDNTRYHSFKRENDTIKRRLIQPKGALEYALALGFRPKVTDFQSYYAFHPSKMADLRIGAAILDEALERETAKEARTLRNREEQKAAATAAAQNVKLAFLQDRKDKMMRDERERALREIRESARGTQIVAGVVPPASESPPHWQESISMPGSGHTLVSDSVDQEPGMD
ncbi:hypothetical protein JVU11DRAFT_1898 [Chiua virens]|nr:hypothetical protein JVU11DRAFT_1898 [Chiua virens]